MKTKKGKLLAPVLDIQTQLCAGYHNYDTVRNEMRLIRNLGFDRVYFVLCQPGYPSFCSPWFSAMSPGKENNNNHFLESLLELGDPNWAFMYECKKLGMDAYAIIKSYEGGGHATIPHKAIARYSRSQEQTVGGEQVFFDSFLSHHPDFRVKRKPEPRLLVTDNDNIVSIEISFMLDAIEIKNRHETRCCYNGVSDSELDNLELEIWLSTDNSSYKSMHLVSKCSRNIERQIIHDANGTALFEEPKRCLVIRFSGFEIPNEYRYLAITVNKCLVTNPSSMIKIFSKTEELPATMTTYVRNVMNQDSHVQHEWGNENHPVTGDAAYDTFNKWGFEFEFRGTGYGKPTELWECGWQSSPVYGIGRGKFKYLKGTACEAYPEVRNSWLDQVDKVVCMGFNGIDFRMQNHSNMVSDYVNYGYNEPIINRYKEKYGVDIINEKADPLKIMSIRGEFYTLFLRDAEEIIHAAGRKLQIHLRHCYEDPILSYAHNELGFCSMPKVLLDWKKAIDLADEITIKDYYHNKYRTWMSKGIKEYARDQGKLVWTHCYIDQGNELNSDYIHAIEADEYIGGILLYEVANSERAHSRQGLISIHEDGDASYSQPNVEMLLSCI